MRRGRCLGNLLADEENIDRAEIEVIEERESGKPIIRRMLSGVQLVFKSSVALRVSFKMGGAAP